MKYTYEKYDSAREQYSCDKRELLLRVEKEKQEYIDREQSKFQQRISSIQKLNDNLSKNLRDKQTIEEAYAVCQD